MSMAYIAYRTVVGPPFKNGEEYKFYAKRLASYEACAERVSYTRLAGAGYYYPGTGENVVCCSCQQITPMAGLKDLLGQEITETHLEASPDCTFVKANVNKDKNFQLLEKGAPMPEKFKDAVNYMARPIMEDALDPRHPEYAPLDAGLDDNCFFCNGGLDNWSPGDGLWIEHAGWFPDCQYVRNKMGYAFVSHIQNREDTQAKHMERDAGANSHARRHGERLCVSATDNSPEATPSLAGLDDQVNCFFCHGGLGNWSPGDVLWIEHAGWFPDCQHVRKKMGSAFVSLVQNREDTQATHMVRDVGPNRNPQRHEERLGVSAADNPPGAGASLAGGSNALPSPLSSGSVPSADSITGQPLERPIPDQYMTAPTNADVISREGMLLEKLEQLQHKMNLLEEENKKLKEACGLMTTPETRTADNTKRLRRMDQNTCNNARNL